MRSVTYSMGVSLDGYIVGPDGDFNWTVPDEEVFRFWHPGGGYDENVWNERPIPEILDYIHMNPVRRGLVEQPTDWTWSSARFWSGNRDVPLLMDPIDV